MLSNLFRKWIQNRNRAIFHYWDGSKYRTIDPMVAYRELDLHSEFDWETHPLLIDPPEGESADTRLSVEAMGITADAVRTAFHVPLYEDGRGLTEGELVNLLTEYAEWMNALKKNTRPLPISPEPTEPESSEAESDTNVNSVCGSTSTA